MGLMRPRGSIGRSAIRLRVLAIPLTLGGLAGGCAAVAATSPPIGADEQPTATLSAVADGGADVVAAGAATDTAFPLAVERGKRHLVDATGRPFLIHGDVAWSLITQPTREDVDRYLDDRRARGFNTILVSLIEAMFATAAPANAYGEVPFDGQPFEAFASIAGLLPSSVAPRSMHLMMPFTDFTKPNEAYFAHADWVLRRATDKRFLVLLAPSFAGFEGGKEGWYRAMLANGPDRLRQYGEYLGKRYRDFSNLLWVHAGDFNPPRKDLVRAIAEGIAKYDTRALHTAHGAPETAAIDYWQGEAWLDLNTVYTYQPVYEAALKQYARAEQMPFFLFESTYENEHGVDERRLRTQAYQALLCGAAGQIFGNNPLWHFDGRGLYRAPVTWQEALGSPGTRSMTYLGDLLTTLPWWLMEPDTNGRLLTGGVGSGHARAVAAGPADGSFALLYLPSNRDITVDLRELAGPRVAAHWYDPTNGRFSAVSGSPFSATESRTFRPQPASNSSGFDDWVLLLESQS